MSSGKKRASAPDERGGVRVQAPRERLRRERRERPTPRRGTQQPARTRGPRRYPRGGARGLVWRMRPEEGRGARQVARGPRPWETLRGNALQRPRGSRDSARPSGGPPGRPPGLATLGHGVAGSPPSQPWGGGVSVGVPVSRRACGQAVGRERRKSTDCQAGSGHPTVREERGADGNVRDGGMRHPRHTPQGCRTATLCLRLRAPSCYPTSGACRHRGDSGTWESPLAP